jgi:phage tail-like protein
VTVSARDANDATWYMLRYAEDFVARGTPSPQAPFGDPSAPYLEPSLFFDGERGRLELLPEPPEHEVLPLSGLAVDIQGELYRVDPATGRLRVRRCDGSEQALTCEPHVLIQPAGLALDRRGLLYVADPAARRVVVLLPEDGSVQAVLDGALTEPVDVAVSAEGWSYVADRAGALVVYTPRFARHARFIPTLPSGGAPRPIGVMIAEDGSVLVADARHPRLLRFTPAGEPLGDVELRALAASLAGGDVALDALERAYGARAPRFLAAGCCPLPGNDGGVRLASVHRALRLLRLSLGRQFQRNGVFVSRALDSGVPGTTWHKVELDAELPPGTSVTIETLTAEGAPPPPGPAPAWEAPRDASGAARPFRPEVPDQLVQSPPGRFLWLRVTLSSDGTETPSVRAIRVRSPRNSYATLLPPAFLADPEAALFVPRFLSLFEHVFTDIEDRYDTFNRQLFPGAAPREVIDWLATLIDLAFDPSWSLERRRALVAEGISLYRTRGTVRGLERYVEIYTGVRPRVVERFLSRPGRPAFLGRPGSILGCGLPLLSRPDATPDGVLYDAYAHRFLVHMYVDDSCDAEVMRKVVDHIIEVNKPAHTVHELRLVFPDAQVGLQSTVGLDFVVGAAQASKAQVGDPLEGPPPRGGTLGKDTVLGERRGDYLRPAPFEL